MPTATAPSLNTSAGDAARSSGSASDVAHASRARARPHDVGAGAEAPAPERLAEVFVLALEADLARDVEEAAEAEERVGRRSARPSSQAGSDLALQEVVDRRPGIADVAEEVVDAACARAAARRSGSRGHRLQHVLVERLVEREHLAVPVFPRIELARPALRRCSADAQPPARAAATMRRQRQQDAVPRAAMLISSLRRARRCAARSALPASAALLNRNWPIRFSSTTADCVCVIAVAGGEVLLVAARLEADVLVAQQAGGQDLGRRVLRELHAACRSPA